MKRIAVITARSGSKGLPDKNIKLLNGKPLLAYSVECAIESKAFDKIFVSTDSAKYAEIAKEYGAEASFLRSELNSGDKAGSWDTVREVIDRFREKGEEFDEVMLLQPTSPLRTAQDICGSIELMHEKNANGVISFTECDHSPIWCNTIPENGSIDNFDRPEYKDMPRQLLPTYYRYNGAIYLLTVEELYKADMFERNCFAYIMPQERSIDIDTELDFKIAETILNYR